MARARPGQASVSAAGAGLGAGVGGRGGVPLQMGCGTPKATRKLRAMVVAAAVAAVGVRQPTERFMASHDFIGWPHGCMGLWRLTVPRGLGRGARPGHGRGGEAAHGILIDLINLSSTKTGPPAPGRAAYTASHDATPRV